MNRIKIDIIGIYILIIVGFITGGITSIIGVVYAYIRKASVKGTPDEQEYKDAIKIFWILLIISFLPFLIILVFFILPIFGITSLIALTNNFQ